MLRTGVFRYRSAYSSILQSVQIDSRDHPAKKKLDDSEMWCCFIGEHFPTFQGHFKRCQTPGDRILDSEPSWRGTLSLLRIKSWSYDKRKSSEKCWGRVKFVCDVQVVGIDGCVRRVGLQSSCTGNTISFWTSTNFKWFGRCSLRLWVIGKLTNGKRDSVLLRHH